MVCGHLSVFLLWAPQRSRMAQITYCVWMAYCALRTIRKKATWQVTSVSFSFHCWESEAHL